MKIGHAKNVTVRIASLQTGSSVELRLIRVLDGGQPTEAWLHKRFASYRGIGEWFRFHDDMMTIEPPPEQPREISTHQMRDKISVEDVLRWQEIAPLVDEETHPQIVAIQFAGHMADDDARAFLRWIRMRIADRRIAKAEAA